MAKNKLLTEDERKVIEDVYRASPKSLGKDVREAVNKKLDRELALSTVQGELTKLRRKDKKVQERFEEYWHIGMSRHFGIPEAAVPRILEIQATIRRDQNAPTYRLPALVGYWIGRLHAVTNNPMQLFCAAYAYAMYSVTAQSAKGTASEDDSEDKPILVDTGDLDNLLAAGDFDALIVLAAALYGIDRKSQPTTKVGNDLAQLMANVRKAVKENPLEKRRAKK